MTTRSTTALGAATLLMLLGAAQAPAAGAAETIRYRVGMDLAGTWAETVRADVDRDDVDHDGTEEVAIRDSSVRWALRATLPDVALRDGRVVDPVTDVAETSLTQEVTSTYTDWDGATGTCAGSGQAASGGALLAPVGEGMVFRSSSDAFLDFTCTDGHVRFSMRVSLLHLGATNELPELGQAPIDVPFTIPARRFGARRIEIPVSASAAQRTFERCPREDPGHTLACPFGWEGKVLLERLSPEAGAARLAADGASASVLVHCFAACRPTLRLGAARDSYKLPAGASRRLALRLSKATRATLRRGRPAKLVVAIGDERHAFTLRAPR